MCSFCRLQDLTFLLAAAGAMGLAFEAIQQPVINGYLVAGAIVGPGGFALIKELVQVGLGLADDQCDLC